MAHRRPCCCLLLLLIYCSWSLWQFNCSEQLQQATASTHHFQHSQSHSPVSHAHQTISSPTSCHHIPLSSSHAIGCRRNITQHRRTLAFYTATRYSTTVTFTTPLSPAASIHNSKSAPAQHQASPSASDSAFQQTLLIHRLHNHSRRQHHYYSTGSRFHRRTLL